MPAPGSPSDSEHSGGDPSALNAVVLGATGAVGGCLVQALLQSPHIGKVTTLGRRPLELDGFPSGRLVHRVVDVFEPAAYETHLAGHQAAFCTLGVGQPSKVTPEELYRVDVECAFRFASACRRKGVSHFTLMTAVGASSTSRTRYLRYKAGIEDKVRVLGFRRASFFRPSMLLTPANRYGLVQAVMLRLFPFIDPLLAGPLASLRSITVEALGRAMALNAGQPGSGAEILQWRDFQRILGRN